MKRAGNVPFDERVSDVYVQGFTGCQDLDGDGLEELVLQIACCTGGAADPWVIFGQVEGRWKAELIRMRGSVSVRLTPEGVRETSAAYGPGDPTCCPAVELGGFDLQNGNLPASIDRFGTPTSYSSDSEICPAQWHDIGLVINFVNLGGSDPCGPDGRVGSVVLTGAEAEQAGWTVSGSGVMVGDSQGDLRAAYPSMAPSEFQGQVPFGEAEGRSWVLVDRPVPYGVSDRTPTLSARLDFGEAVAFDVSVGAGGE